MVRAGIVAVAALAAVGGAAAGVHPTGLAVADALYGALVAALAAGMASRCRRWAWLITAAVAVCFAGGWLQVVALIALLAAFAGGFLDRRDRLLGAAVGAVSAQVLLRLPAEGPLPMLRFSGATALVAVVGLAPIVVSGYRHAPAATRRWLRAGALVAGLAVVTIGIIFAGAGLAAKTRVEQGISDSQRALQAARRGDLAESQRLLDSAATDLDAANGLVGSWWAAPARVVPVLGIQADALTTVTSQGASLAEEARATVRTGDYHDLRYRSGSFNLDLVRQVQQPLRRSTAALRSTTRTLDAIDSPWLVGPVRDRLDRYRAELVDARDEAELAREGSLVVPGLLGGAGERHYLVLFTTPSEQRGLGGFIGDYAELTAVDGRIRMTRSGPIQDLLDAVPRGIRQLHGPADYLRRYGRYDLADYLQDLTLSPDFPSVATVAADLYQQSGGSHVDGVIAVDPYGLQALLTFTGPIRVDGLDEPLTRANAARVLLKDQYLQFGRQGEREDFLRQATRTTFEKLTTGSLPAPESISRVMSPEVRGGHFSMWSPRPAEETFFEHLHADGAFPRPDGGDLFAVRAQNSAHNKIDLFLDRRVDYRARADTRTGEVRATATITFTNRAPASGLPNYVIGNTVNLPLGTNRMNLAFYSPLQVRSVTVSGLALPFAPDTELGWGVTTTALAVPPGETRTVVVTLSGRIAPGPYHLTLAPQPAVNPSVESTTVVVDGTRRTLLAARPLTQVTRLGPTG